MTSKIFHPVQSKGKLIRLGKQNDGGYILNKDLLINSTVLLSFGINRDWSFEKSFISNRNCSRDIKIFMFDPFTPINNYGKIWGVTIDFLKSIFVKKSYVNQTNIEIIKVIFRPFFFLIYDHFKYCSFKSYLKNNTQNHFFSIGVCGDNEKENFKSLRTIFNERITNLDKVLIKMDIEGDEYDTLIDFFTKNNYKNIIGLTVEFHDITKNYEKLLTIIDNLKNNGLELIHIHCNNYTEVIPQIGLTNVIEATFSQYEYCTTALSDSKYPIIGLDSPCNKNKKDIDISFE